VSIEAPGEAGPGQADRRPFEGLRPELILDAVEACGLPCDGTLLALNSYENRVYRVGRFDGPPVVAKFYRPGRWSAAAIREEHAFARELGDRELPVVAPWSDEGGETLFEHGGFAYAIFPMRAGEWPELDRPGRLRWLGHLLGRIHAVGALRPFRHRPRLDPASFGQAPRAWLLESGMISDAVAAEYAMVSAAALERVRLAFDAAGAVTELRLHGDCHPGNVLWSVDEGPAFVDLDDCRSGPAVQDLWMLLSGNREERRGQLVELLGGYREFHPFRSAELALIEPLRTLRMLHYAAWLARRWNDPAFPMAFPWFGTRAYWDGHVADLREQLAALEEPALDPDW
jgi:Ser/Thr protein kinase RdoA (MazF antagonist)